MQTTTISTEQHWQDFERSITIGAAQAGDAYRALSSIKTTLRMVADHHLRLNSGGVSAPRLSAIEIESMLAGAIALSAMVEGVFEEEHAGAGQ